MELDDCRTRTCRTVRSWKSCCAAATPYSASVRELARPGTVPPALLLLGLTPGGPEAALLAPSLQIQSLPSVANPFGGKNVHGKFLSSVSPPPLTVRPASARTSCESKASGTANGSAASDGSWFLHAFGAVTTSGLRVRRRYLTRRCVRPRTEIPGDASPKCVARRAYVIGRAEACK